MHTFRAILALALASSVRADDTHSGTKRILAVHFLEKCTEQSIGISRQSDFMANHTARHLLWHATALNSGNCVWRQGALDMVQTEQTVVVEDETAVGEPRLAAFVLPTANDCARSDQPRSPTVHFPSRPRPRGRDSFRTGRVPLQAQSRSDIEIQELDPEAPGPCSCPRHRDAGAGFHGYCTPSRA